MDFARGLPARSLIDTPRRDHGSRWRRGAAVVALAAMVGAAPAMPGQRPTPGPTDTRREAPPTDVESGAGHYFAEQLRRPDLVARRWPERVAAPIRLWIQPLPATCACAAAFPAMFRAAVAEWEAVGLPLRFTEVSDSGTAEIHVVWSERLEEDESGRAVWWSTSQGWITRARITVRTHRPAGTLAPDWMVRAVALHEIGHVLGLGHVTDPQHVMAAWVSVASLSEADRRTARLLYRLPAGRVSPAVLTALSRSSDGPDAGGRLSGPTSGVGAP